jgi:predicted Zn-dependent protease with MMP-like domain
MRRKQFERLVEAAYARIPERFRDALENVQIIVEDWPDPELMEEVTGDPDDVLYGLFAGTPLTERHLDDIAPLPAVIHLYQGPLEQDFRGKRELVRQIEITLVHEIAHFLGFDEEKLEEYGYD